MLYNHTFRCIQSHSGEWDCGVFRFQGVENLPYPEVNSPALKICSLSVVRTCPAWATSLWSVIYLYVKLKSPLPLYIIFPWISIRSYFHSVLFHFISALLQEFKVFKWKSCVVPEDDALLGQALCSTRQGKGKCKHNFHQYWMTGLTIPPLPPPPHPWVWIISMSLHQGPIS